MGIKVCDYKSAKKFVEENSSATLISTEYKRQRDEMNFICKCGEPFATSMDAFIRKNVRQCNKCGYSNGAKKNALTHSEFMERAEKLLGREFKILEGNYKNQKSTFIIYHEVCGESFSRTAQKILSCKNECGVCGSNVKRKKEQVQEELNLFSNEIEVVEYINSDKVVVMHTICGATVNRPMTELRKHRGFYCPVCKSSYGVRKIIEYLTKNNIDFIREYEFDECKNIRKLPFDFYLPKLNACIEFDGDHHDRVLYHWGGEVRFNEVQKRDSIKNNFCKNNNIPLLRIKDKHKDNIEDILYNFINKIIPR